MYRIFISWRYFRSRRTNIIGMLGIFVGVGALILILSIMTGFLEVSRQSVRGSLSDILIEPRQGFFGESETEEAEILRLARATPGVAGATAQLQGFGLISHVEGQSSKFESILSSPAYAKRLAVQLVGIDVLSDVRIAWPLLRTQAAAGGHFLPDLKVQDEFDATDFDLALARDIGEPEADDYRREAAPVESPLFPFQPPPGFRPRGLRPPTVLMGQQLFRVLGFSVGDVIEIVTVVRDHEHNEWQTNNMRFVLGGTFRTRENEMDLGSLYVQRDVLADLTGNRRTFSHVLVRLDDYDHDGRKIVSEMRRGLGTAGLLSFPEEEVVTWEEFRGNLLKAIENERFLMGIMLCLVLLVAGFTVYAILSMMVTEKRRDIGILSALGATRRGILQLFLMIAFWDALIGALGGAVVGVWMALRIDAIERWLSDFFGIVIFNREVYLFDHIPSIVVPYAVAVIVLGAFVCTLLFAALPAIQASRMDPLQALRYE